MILFCGSYDNEMIGGMETHAIAFANYFQSYGSLKKIVCMKPSFIIKTADNATIKEFDNVEETILHLSEESADLLFFNDGHWIEHIEKLRRYFRDAKFIMRSGGNEFVKAPWRDNKLCLSERQNKWADIINKNMDFIIANSRFTINRMTASGINEEKIILVRGGVDIEKCEINVRGKQELRNRFDDIHGTSGKVLFCIASRFEKFKGISEILGMFSSIRKTCDWHIVFVGYGPEEENIRTYCKNNFKSSDYTFTGKKSNEETMEYIAISDYLVNCSVLQNKPSGNELYIHTETMGRSMLEAICQCTPVIATDSGATKELFDENENIGVLLNETKDAEIESYIKNKYCALNQAHCFDHYGWKNIFGNIYAKLFSVTKADIQKKGLCFDIDGTITHNFLSDTENEALINQVLALRHECAVIFNSARDYEDVLKSFSQIEEVLEEIYIISNFGKRIVAHGTENEFWKAYADSIRPVGSSMIESVLHAIEEEIVVRSIKIIDGLYINYKAPGITDEKIAEINNGILFDSEFTLRRNDNNVKLISKIINKGTAFTYLKNRITRFEHTVGIGNNVLDYAFMQECDRAYVINSNNIGYRSVYIKDYESAAGFIKELRRAEIR